jgi:histone-lysine N-methyltransferase SETMAR
MVPESYMRVVQKVKTASTRALFADFAWDVFYHPPYSPDLAPSDFNLITHLKQFLGGMCIGGDEEVKKMVKDWFTGGRFL